MTVSFTDWLSETASCVGNTGGSRLRCLLRALYFVYAGALLTVERSCPIGTNVFEREWDALIVLDACRVDALREVSSEYEFLHDVDSITSVGSMTPEWMSNTFRRRYLSQIKRTGYVTENGFIEKVLEDGGHTGFDALPIGPRDYDVVTMGEFGHIEKLWMTEFEPSSKWMVGDGGASRLSPSYVTSRAIEVGRTADVERLIVHYTYPHEPYPLAPPPLDRPFDAISNGDATGEEVWRAYLDNLRFVLGDVETLLNNMDAEKVVITADHGEAFGEWGFYQHVIGCPIPCVRRVPWVETEAEDTEEYTTVAPEPQTDSGEKATREQLRKLGYL